MLENISYKIYQKIGDYLTGSDRRYCFWTIMFILFVLLIIFSNFFRWTISVNTFYWFFSSLIQSLVTLVALLGVVLVFKLQGVKDEEQYIIRLAFNPSTWLSGYFHSHIITSGVKLLSELNLLLESQNPEEKLAERLRDRLKELANAKKNAIDFMVRFAIYTFAVVILSIIFLIISPLLSKSFLAIPIIFLMVIFTAYSLFLSIKGATSNVWF